MRVNKWLNELEQGFYGSALAYDNALTGGSADFAKVLHRNVFHGEGVAGEDARAKNLERYVRRELGCLAATDGKAVREGRSKCASPASSDAKRRKGQRQDVGGVVFQRARGITPRA